MELVVVLCASEEQEAIVQSRCHGLTGMNKYIRIYTNAKRQHKAITCLALQLSNYGCTTDGTTCLQRLNNPPLCQFFTLCHSQLNRTSENAYVVMDFTVWMLIKEFFYSLAPGQGAVPIVYTLSPISTLLM